MLSSRPIITCKKVLDKEISVLQADLRCSEIVPLILHMHVGLCPWAWGFSARRENHSSQRGRISSPQLLKLLLSSAMSNTVPEKSERGVYDWKTQILFSHLTRIAFPRILERRHGGLQAEVLIVSTLGHAFLFPFLFSSVPSWSCSLPLALC